jgi:hypothetical protein
VERQIYKEPTVALTSRHSNNTNILSVGRASVTAAALGVRYINSVSTLFLAPPSPPRRGIFVIINPIEAKRIGHLHNREVLLQLLSFEKWPEGGVHKLDILSARTGLRILFPFLSCNFHLTKCF